MTQNSLQFKLSFSIKIIFLFSLLLVCLYLTTAICALVILKLGMTFTTLNIQIMLQNILAFAFPAVAVAYFSSKKPFHFLKLDKAPKLSHIAYLVLVYIVAIPVMNLIIDWNSNIHLPESMNALETLLREFEDSAKNLTDQLTSTQSFFGLISLVFTVGILTGFGEEVFFRGMLTQAIIQKPCNKHVAIWIGAFVFSLMHFQFFGFVPRMLLGAFFGYLLVWSDNLWIPIIAHAINNSSAIIVKFLERQGMDTSSFDSIGTSNNMIWTAIISAIIVTALIIYRNKFGFQKSIVND